MRNKISFFLNGKKQSVGAKEAHMMLADYLRYEKCLTGTKIVCAEGDCGACSILRYFPYSNGVDSQNYQAINSCITPVASLDGSSLVTVDALKEDDRLHESQRAMVECHGSQCGFCTPGFVIALTGLVEEKIARGENKIEEQEAKNCMTGNLCRCTGYDPIIDAALDMDLSKERSVKERFYSDQQKRELDEIYSEEVLIKEDNYTFYAPKTLKAACDFLKNNPAAKILASGSDLGVVHNKRKLNLTQLLSLHLIEELYEMNLSQDGLKIGARVTLTEFRHLIKNDLPEFADYLDVFASPQIKNIGTVVGNVANASPIGDTPPPLLALRAKVHVFGPNGEREIEMSDFFLDYRKTALEKNEIITAISLKKPSQTTDLRFFKNANRKDLDISAVNFAIAVEWKDALKKDIADITIAAGGVAATPLRFKKTEQALKKSFDIDKAVEVLHTEFTPLSDVRATSAYRHILIENFLRRSFKEFKEVR